MIPVWCLFAALVGFAPQAAPPTDPHLDPLRAKIPTPWVFPGAMVPFPKFATFIRGPEAVRYAPGIVYAFDFFSTTCDHCEEAGPLVAEMARVYEAKGVRFIGISSEPAATISAWLEKPPQHDDISYAIVSDPPHAADRVLQDGTLRRSTPLLMLARDGVMLWYGHPNDAEPVLAAIVKGSWDPLAIKAERVLASRIHYAKDRIESLARDCERSGQWGPIFALLDAIIAQMPQERTQFELQRFTIMIGVANEPAKGYALGREIAANNPEDAATRRAMARTTVNSTFATVRDLDFALEMATQADALGQGSDALAKVALALVHFARGDAAKAIECQEQAITLQSDAALVAKYKVELERYRTQPAGPLPTRKPKAP